MKKVCLKASLIVAGGGLSGVCAALAAARIGIDTILVHNRPVLGGNSSSEIRVWTRGATGGGNLFSEEMGVLGILKMRNLYTNPRFNPVFWDEVLLDAVLGQKNITLLLNTNVEHVECTEGCIRQISGVQQASEIEYIMEGKMFIDATGDGILGDQCGVPYQIGNYGYNGDNKNRQREILSSSILYYVRDTGEPVPFIAPEYAYDMNYIESLVNKGGRIISEKQTGSDCWWFEYGGFQNTISDSQEIAIELKKLVLGIWNYIKNSGKYPEAENCTLEWLGSIPGKRESRRMITEYQLSRQDILESKKFEDGAFYGGWYMDFHPPGGLNSIEESCTQIPVNVYQIPLRCLYNHKVKNLLFAGRNIGTEQEAFSSSRVMNTCALSGQAASTLAWKCMKEKKQPADLSATEIRQIIETLIREDMFIPGKKSEEQEDLGKVATVTASSEYQIKDEMADDFLSLKEGTFLTVPVSEGTPVLLRMKNYCGNRVVRFAVAYFLSDLPSCLKSGRKVKEEEVEIAPGEHWVELELPRESENQFCTIWFEKNDQLGIRLNKIRNPGILCGRGTKPEYLDPCIMWDEKGIYSPKHVINGYSRPYQGTNLWCSKQEKNPWILLEWKNKILFRELRLFFDPELSMEIPSSCTQRWDESHRFAMRKGMPPQLIREFRVDVFEDGEWKYLAKVSNNWQRMLVLDFEKDISAEKIRITFDRTWGDSRAHLYQISVYKNKITFEKEEVK
ncbi:MAG: FAD-dependent oxidoreductase [Blautia sp.]|nr:FAD-dependent oxidoreductase [Blautia sp.]